MRIPVFRTPRSLSLVASDLLLHGIVVADAMRPHSSVLAGELRQELGIDPDDEQHDFLLHLSCAVEPVGEHGWVDYFVYSRAFPRDPMKAKELVCAAVRQWGDVGKPDYFVAKLNP
ncbi:hypothetical protein [Stenotrophomonas sp. NLF4-10]|uniref:hypothetical protein n=1 Tax=Stenotrophomonas sp. NLF4-10 TaxID=2918754 RepID=UPI001EFC23A9|nr:hypothetical protein [Stenotrophomonas sp. NLF4-10]MCG8275420.1 hypothetical protein [Stenotrophomonas sp. NLF4-10]